MTDTTDETQDREPPSDTRGPQDDRAGLNAIRGEGSDDETDEEVRAAKGVQDRPCSDPGCPCHDPDEMISARSREPSREPDAWLVEQNDGDRWVPCAVTLDPDRISHPIADPEDHHHSGAFRLVGLGRIDGTPPAPKPDAHNHTSEWSGLLPQTCPACAAPEPDEGERLRTAAAVIRECIGLVRGEMADYARADQADKALDTIMLAARTDTEADHGG